VHNNEYEVEPYSDSDEEDEDDQEEEENKKGDDEEEEDEENAKAKSKKKGRKKPVVPERPRKFCFLVDESTLRCLITLLCNLLEIELTYRFPLVERSFHSQSQQ